MMKFVKIKNRLISLFIIFLFLGCNKKQEENYSRNEYDLYFFDVVGNSNIDTLVVESSETIRFNKIISIISNGNKLLICEITPRLDSSFMATSPKIENIYLEANAIQTKNKGFRLISRNTDIEPEYFFVDFYFDEEWVVKEAGFSNISGKNQFICKHSIEQKITNFNKLVNPKNINQIYFNGIYCN